MLNNRLVSIIFILISFSCFGNDKISVPSKTNKGKFFFYWGWNKCNYTKSDMHFQGSNYNFTLNDVVSSDNQLKFNLITYLNPLTITVPQFNARLGYNISEHYSLSLGDDHMKYVMIQNQNVKISGNINVENYPKYNRSYNNSDINLAEDFLILEHCDGLNYLNIELRRFDEIINLKKIKTGDISISVIEGIGIGALIPRSNVTLLMNERYHVFHFAGYGTAVLFGLKLQLLKHFFIQSELKGGFINLPDIRTTVYSSDKASQHFFFFQRNIVFGWAFRL